MEERRKERRASRINTAGFSLCALCYLAMACRSCWDHRLWLGLFCAFLAALCAGGALLERERQNASEYCEDLELALALLRKARDEADDALPCLPEEEALVCPRCGGRTWHRVGGKRFCSLCLEEMRRE